MIKADYNLDAGLEQGWHCDINWCQVCVIIDQVLWSVTECIRYFTMANN